MGKFFSDVVEQALRDIYYDVTTGRGQESFRRLEKASAAGDGDATCILARCLCGYQYVWRGHEFPEDDDRAEALMHEAVEQGSAMGVLLALRSGALTPELKARMPFADLKEAFEIVLEKAEGGEPFCQYTVGNVYFWWDFLEIEGKGRESFPDIDSFRAYLRANISKCEDWFWKAFRGGMYYAGNNLCRYYEKGDEDLIAPQPQKAETIWETGAKLGYPIHQHIYAKDLAQAGREAEALEWHKKAAENGEKESWYFVGRAYEEGKVVPQDCAYAARCYEKGPADSIGCCNRLGALLFDGKGVPQDYVRAVELLTKAFDQDNKWGIVYLAKAYFNGLGVQKDYVRARTFLEKVTWVSEEAYYMLGVIYARGLGVSRDIKKGAEYLQKAGSLPEAGEELSRYKKTLFGKWVEKK